MRGGGRQGPGGGSFCWWRGEAAAPPTWVAEAKERMAEVAATEPQGSLRGIRSLESSGEAPEQRAVCVGGRIRGWAGGADGGRGEKIKGPVGPQTVTVVGLCPLPPPASLYSPGGPGGSWVGRGAVVRCCFHHSWLLFSAAAPPCVCVLPLRISSIAPSAAALFVRPWALRVMVGCVQCSCCFRELLWVCLCLLLSLPPFPHPPLGTQCVSPDWSFALFHAGCCHLPGVHPWVPAMLCRLPSHGSLWKPESRPEAWMTVSRSGGTRCLVAAGEGRDAKRGETRKARIAPWRLRHRGRETEVKVEGGLSTGKHRSRNAQM